MKRSTVLDVEEKDRQRLAFIAANRAQRAAALHDPNVKIASVDTALCQIQINEKANRRARQMEADRHAAAEEQRIAKVIAQAELEHKLAEQKTHHQLRECWRQQADPRARREADLNPKLSKHERPDADNCGLTACQKFFGEDRNRIERTRLQQRQMYHYTTQQHAEKAAREATEKENDRAYVKTITDLEKMGDVWEKQEYDNTRGAAIQTRKNNEYAVSAKKAQLEAYRRQQQRDDRNELAYQQNSKFLNEIPDGSKQSYKGMTPEERLAILVDNRHVIQEKARLKQQDSKEDRMWAAKATSINRTILAGEIEEQEERKRAARQLQESHKWQMTEVARTRAEAKRNSCGGISGGWFTQFGTSHR